MNISLPFMNSTPPRAKRKVKKVNSKINRNLIRFRNNYTPVEIYNMDDAQLENLYEHGSPSERDIANEIKKKRSNWDTVVNKGLDDTLPSGSGVSGAPTAGGN
jgi:hypothetical protein